MTDRNLSIEPVDANSGEHVARVSQQGLRSLFQVIAGRPDSIFKAFSKPILVSVKDVDALQDKFLEKLELHHCHAGVVTVDVALEKGLTRQFGTYEAFAATSWEIPERVESVTIRWELLIKLPGKDLPQRHSATIRIANAPDPGEFLRYAFSRDEHDETDVSFGSSVFARIDYSNPKLAQEFLAVVTEWYDALRKPILEDALSFRVLKHHQKFSNVIRYVSPVVVVVLSLALVRFLFGAIDSAGPVSSGQLVYCFQWLLLTLLGVGLAERFGQWIAYNSLEHLRRSSVVTAFDITAGDKNRRDSLQRSNKKNMRRFLLNVAATLILNIVGGVIATYLFTSVASQG